MTASNFAFHPQRLHYYTGLETYGNFILLFRALGETVNELNYYYGVSPSLAPEDQLFLTLVKLRLAQTNFELSMLFEINIKEVTNVFVTWINFLYHHWWPSRDLVSFFTPSDFRKKFPTTRVIVDGTEIPMKKPHQPVAQQATYSTYKNRNTAKVLVGVTPGGLVSFVSDAYGGSASDRQICERSNLSQICDPGDSIMADKGFNVQDLFISSNVEINIPEFFKKKNRMSAKSVTKDRKIASKRVHVERIIGLAKTYKIRLK
ncbi:PREDICTED: uncharacterized protein LOC106815500 [Priapulus caudatus]|uniref:Uncharacterized protein LOC106815500 n=1 Tax=Priapulus caudatus TaxID=37621 RepID=A0ABM1ETC8_PRICU|nr:PREDICTED: uncharacterized protein LOC106815500 [Priapulus caudatus]